MAESCVVVRCVQERRTLKRELQKWSKNVLYLVGLERVAEELIGHDKWTQVKPQSHLNEDDTPKEVIDWNPNENCCFCANRRITESPVEPDSVDDAPTEETAELDSLKPDSMCGSRPSSPSSPDSDQPLDLSLGSKPRPALLDSLFNGEAYGSALLKVPQVPDKSGKLKRRLEPSSAVVAAAAAAAAAASNCKRSYTDEELQAALRDIRSGKLGTRRAAVIYGIPRSTLRNKVYKLTLGDGGSTAHDSPPPPNAAPLSPDDLMLDAADVISGNDGGGGGGILHPATSASESLRQLLRNRMFDKPLGATKQSFGLDGQDSGHQSLGPLLLSHMLASIHQQQLGGGGDDDVDDPTSNTDDELKLPLLPDLIRKLSEERFEQERHRHRLPPTLQPHQPPSTAGDCTDDEAGAGSVILKIPSYKPVKTVNHFPAANGSNNNNNDISVSTTSTSNSATIITTTTTSSTTVPSSQSNGTGESKVSKGIGVTLREIIAKSITQRAHNKESKRAAATTTTASESLLRPLAPAPSPNSAATPLHNGNTKRMRVVDHHGSRSDSQKEQSVAGATTIIGSGKKESKNGGGGGSSKLSEKRVRPKRGRYRNYDRDNLVEAVRAVQRGEMSVHRAGSYYGVPHSTLEYKVKERHLLRPRKNRGGGNNNGSSKMTADGEHKVSTTSNSTTAVTPSSGGNGKRRHSSSSEDDGGISDGCQHSDGSVSSRSKGHTPTAPSDGGRRNHRGGDATPSTSVHQVSSATATTSSSSAPSSLWPNSPLFAVDFGGRLNSGNFFASQMMRKLQEDALTQGGAGSGSGGGGGGGGEHNLSSRDALLLGVLIRNGLQATEASAGK